MSKCRHNWKRVYKARDIPSIDAEGRPKTIVEKIHIGRECSTCGREHQNPRAKMF